MEERKRTRVLMAKIGLNGHDRGVLVVSMALRDAGMEVIYTGRHQTPEQVARVAIQEDVDIIGISSLADAHRTLVPRVAAELRKMGSEIPIVLGGFIQPEDVAELKGKGVVDDVFGIGTRLDTVVEYIRKKVSRE